MTRHDDKKDFFAPLSICGLATSAMGTGVTVGNWGWSLTNFQRSNTLSGGETSAAAIAKNLQTLVKDLVDRGIIPGTIVS
jgi:hypothetical protein